MKRTAARDGRRPEEGCAVRRQRDLLSEPLLPYPPGGARLKSALAPDDDHGSLPLQGYRPVRQFSRRFSLTLAPTDDRLEPMF